MPLPSPAPSGEGSSSLPRTAVEDVAAIWHDVEMPERVTVP